LKRIGYRQRNPEQPERIKRRMSGHQPKIPIRGDLKEAF
jgi:hypothetical protein